MEKEFRFRGPGNLPIIPPLEESDEIEERDEQSAMQMPSSEDKLQRQNLQCADCPYFP